MRNVFLEVCRSGSYADSPDWHVVMRKVEFPVSDRIRPILDCLKRVLKEHHELDN